MKLKKDYDLHEKIRLIQKYRVNGEGSCGSESALAWYKKGIALALTGASFDQKDYEYYYDVRRHCRRYEKKGLQYFEMAADCFRQSAELGNELAMMNYALYLFAFKKEHSQAMGWFLRASDRGLAVADYELAVFYKKGYCGTETDEVKAQAYFQRYLQRCESDERQLILAWDIDNDWSVIGRSFMYHWFCGYSFPEIYDTPATEPPRWKYAR